jgi:hypothetical protein
MEETVTSDVIPHHITTCKVFIWNWHPLKKPPTRRYQKKRIWSSKLISEHRKLITLREANKLWNKLASEEKAIFDKMSKNSFLVKLPHSLVRKV